MADRERIAGQLPGSGTPLNATAEPSLAGRLLDAAAAFHRAARSPNPDPSVVAVTRALDALWLAYRRGDVKLLQEWERPFYNYVEQGRADGERWTGLPLPPRAGLDRAAAIAELQRVAGLLALPRNSAEAVGHGMASTVAMLFPSLCAAQNGAIDGEATRRAAATITAAFQHRLDRMPPAYRNRPMPAEPLVLDTLEAFGVPRAGVHNWLKGTKP